ncbi:MAG TPA: hypothetical protein VLT16_06695 [Candidatus Limnocylindrales bacterium]|nr:hypothetical protein [Candidatus Limnocylindrales bacterium]
MPALKSSQPLPEKPFNQLSKQEVIALLKQITRQLGRVPTYIEFRRISRATQRRIGRLFGGYRELLQQAGFEPLGSGYRLTVEQLLPDWAAVVRRLGRLPTVQQYEKYGKYSQQAFAARWKSWQDVPAVMIEFAAGKRLQPEWEDVIQLARRYQDERKKATLRAELNPAPSPKPSPKKKRAQPSAPGAAPAPGPLYGRPLMMQALATAPTNDMGVLVLFGAMARDLGFTVLRVQAEFPDCEALRLCEGDRWRRVRIEFEFESRNFLAHAHDPKDCDLIVCWKHNWETCPLEVLELSRFAADGRS